MHTIVLVVDKPEKYVSASTVLNKMGFKVVVAQSMYDALKIIDQEMPHLVVSEAILSDGHVGNMYDRLKDHPLVKNTPILALVTSKTKEQLSPLQGRKFAGFLLGKVDPKALALKVREVIAANNNVSPYFIDFDRVMSESDMTLMVRAQALGKSGEQIVYSSGSELDPEAALVCMPEDDNGKGPGGRRGAEAVRRAFPPRAAEPPRDAVDVREADHRDDARRAGAPGGRARRTRGKLRERLDVAARMRRQRERRDGRARVRGKGAHPHLHLAVARDGTRALAAPNHLRAHRQPRVHDRVAVPAVRTRRPAAEQDLRRVGTEQRGRDPEARAVELAATCRLQVVEQCQVARLVQVEAPLLARGDGARERKERLARRRASAPPHPARQLAPPLRHGVPRVEVHAHARGSAPERDRSVTRRSDGRGNHLVAAREHGVDRGGEHAEAKVSGRDAPRQQSRVARAPARRRGGGCPRRGARDEHGRERREREQLRRVLAHDRCSAYAVLLAEADGACEVRERARDRAHVEPEGRRAERERVEEAGGERLRAHVAEG